MIRCQHNLTGVKEVERVHRWLPHPNRCSWPVLILCSVTLQTIFILFWYVSMLSLVTVFICSQDFIHKHFSIISLLFYSSVQNPIFWSYDLEFANRDVAIQQKLKTQKAVILLLTFSSFVSPRFTKIAEKLEGLMFPITGLITN